VADCLQGRVVLEWGARRVTEISPMVRIEFGVVDGPTAGTSRGSGVRFKGAAGEMGGHMRRLRTRDSDDFSREMQVASRSLRHGGSVILALAAVELETRCLPGLDWAMRATVGI